MTVALAATAAVAAVASVAGAAAVSRVVGEASNSMLNHTVVVDVHGRTLYALHPETTHRLLCRSRACFETWPPLLVHSANVTLAAGHGVEGHLGLLHRHDGKLQVTLRGMPLYRFAGDNAKGQANGEGIKTFGGTWHAVPAGTHSTNTPPTNTPPTTTTPTTTTPTPSPPPMTPAYGY